LCTRYSLDPSFTFLRSRAGSAQHTGLLPLAFDPENAGFQLLLRFLFAGPKDFGYKPLHLPAPFCCTSGARIVVKTVMKRQSPRGSTAVYLADMEDASTGESTRVVLKLSNSQFETEVRSRHWRQFSRRMFFQMLEMLTGHCVPNFPKLIAKGQTEPAEHKHKRTEYYLVEEHCGQVKRCSRDLSCAHVLIV